MSAAFLRTELELVAAPRRFATVKGAVLWYLEARAHRCGRAIDLGAVGSPSNARHRDQLQATYARVAECMAHRHAADDAEDFPPRGPPALNDETMEMLCSWLSSRRSQAYLADEAGLPEDGFARWMRRLERVLRERMRARGLLVEELACDRE